MTNIPTLYTTFLTAAPHDEKKLKIGRKVPNEFSANEN
jgi:hypothetical protein